MTAEKNSFLQLIADYYTFAAANGLFEDGFDKTTAWFDMYFRKDSEQGGFSVMAGIEQLTEYLKDLKFEPEDIEFLRSHRLSEDFLSYLSNFEFACDIWAVPEGTPIFAGEPIVKVKGPVIQAMMIETVLLLTVNHQSLIATKANRMVRAAGGRQVVESGTRRAHGFDAAIDGARAAYIGGCSATTCAAACSKYGIPLFEGSMNHSFVQLFSGEIDAFRAYAKSFPDNCILLIDTYDTMHSGLPNAIKVFNEEIVSRGFRPKGVRIDSGDLAYLSKKIRRALNEAGFPDCDIIVSNSLDEYIIREMLQHGARVDTFLAGEHLITASSSPVFNGVYKLAALMSDGKIIPKIKLSENVEKITTPCPKLLWRLFDMETGKAIADLLTLEDENVGDSTEYELFDPDYTWKRKTVTDYVARQLLVPVFENGKCVYHFPKTDEIRAYCAEQIDTLWEEVLRYENPHNYYVDLSPALWHEKQKLIDELRG